MGGQAIHTLVGNIDNDPELEILTTALATGPLYAWNHDGTELSGWPVGLAGAAYPALGDLRTIPYMANPRLPFRRSVVAGYFYGWLAAYDATGAFLPGWPRRAANYIGSPPALGDVVGVWTDEVFTEEQDWQLHGYRHDGNVLPGWPIWGDGGQERHTPAIADLDGDGDLEIISGSGWTTPGVYLHAYHHDGSTVAGFPVPFDGREHTFPAVGDVDGDRHNEIVAVAGNSVWIFSRTGSVKRAIGLVGTVAYGSAPALADLDGNGVPEIVVQTDAALHVFYGDGRRFPGWPVVWGAGYWQGNSSPVVGDVDGDAQMEIVITLQEVGSSEFGFALVFNQDGTVHPRFPKALMLAGGAVPAIADIDRDGRNEIIVCGDAWSGYSGYYDKCWAYDLGGGPHGRIEWGQFGGNAAHQGRYPVPFEGAALAAPRR